MTTLSQLSPQLKDKFQALKMEIRAILVSANELLTPAALDRDYIDLNGHSIPYREFGFPSLYHLLDAMSDTVGAYERNNSILLYAKASNQTEHMESLIARQRKAPRVGRFGGIINKPAEECHGTPERRQLITRRLLNLVAQQPPGYIRFNEVASLYSSKYCEMLDPKDDFYCSEKQLFEMKLAAYFDVMDVGRRKDGFWIALKEEERTKWLAGESGATATKTTSRPAFPEGKVMGSQAQVQVQTTKQVSVVATPVVATPAAVATPIVNVPVVSKPIVVANPVAANPITARPIVADAIVSEPVVANLPIPIPSIVADSSQFPSQAPSQFLSPAQSKQFKENLRRLLIEYPKGVELVVFEWAYYLIFGERIGGGERILNQNALMSLLRQYSGLCELIEKGENRYLIKAKSAPQTFKAPKLSPGCELSADKRSIELKSPHRHYQENYQNESCKELVAGLISKLRPNADQSGNACHYRFGIRDGGDNLDTGKSEQQLAMEKLKVECRTVLRSCPGGVTYLDFPKSYREIIGKRLEIEKYDFFSMIDLVEAMPELFAMEQSNDGRTVILRERKVGADNSEGRQRSKSGQSLTSFHEQRSEIGGNEEMMEMSGESHEDDALVQMVWDVIMGEPSKSLYLHQIPAAYQKATHDALPICDLDEFGLMLFEHGDRFSFKYEDGKLEIVAEPIGLD